MMSSGSLEKKMWTGLTVGEEGDLAAHALESLGYRVAASGMDPDSEFQVLYDVLSSDSCCDVYFTSSPRATTSSFTWWHQTRRMSIAEIIKCLSEAVAFAEYDSLDHRSPTTLKKMVRNPFWHKHGYELAVLADLASERKSAGVKRNKRRS